MLLGPTKAAKVVDMGVSWVGAGNKVQERDQRRAVVRGGWMIGMTRE